MATSGLILDTCALIWIATDAKIEPVAREAVQASRKAGQVSVSPITAWELGMLASKGRLPTTQKPGDLFAEVAALSGVSVGQLTPAILIDSSFLPGDFHGDPADRIIVATARANNLTLVTRDGAILTYARRGYVQALLC